MKSILRKLHIVPAQSEDAAAADALSSPPSTSRGEKPLSGISSWLNSAASRHASSSPSSASSPARDVERREWRESGSSRARELDMDEEEFQIQLALELSAKEDPEAAQIEAVKQISLVSSRTENTPAEVLAYRYWNYNALDYDDKVLDGFYDLYGVLVESPSAKMPSLVDLQRTPVSEGMSLEAVLVNRAEDAELLELEKKSLAMALDLKLEFLDLVRSLATLVAHHMGGAVSDPLSMLESWRNLSNYLRTSTGNMVLPLGRLTIGLARHRALLFKVLADNLGILSRLVKGQQYTGSDDGALNIVKSKDGREYIVDLMVDPGTLIPSDSAGLSRDSQESLSLNSGLSNSAGCYFQSGLLEQRNQERGSSSPSPQKSSAQEAITSEVKVLDDSRSTNQEPSVRPNRPYTIARSPSWTEGINSPAVRMMKVKDISQYMINATKENPDLAQKLRDVLLESGVVAPPNLFTEICTEPSETAMVGNMNRFQDKDEMTNKKLEFKHKSPVCPPLPIQDVHRKIVPSSSYPDPLKPVVGLGFHRPLDVREASAVPFQDSPLQLIKHMPVAAAAATAAVVASSMVVAAAKSKNDMNLEVPVAAAVVATTAAVISHKNGVILDNSQLGSDQGQDGGLVQEQDASEAHQETERKSDKSTGNESTKSDISLDDVAELEIPWEDIILGERIGLGSFGEVYRGEWHGTEIAVKKFLHQDISSDALEEFISEVRIMKRLRHPNVVLLMGAVTRVPNLSIVTEFLPRGSLFRLIHRPNNQLDERKRLRMALDVARGMNYLHNCTPVIVHRDLKSPNLLVDKNWVVKVCDFGLSRMKLNTFLSSRSTAGTAEWMAPEVLCNEPSDEKCDVYSFGVILWELCTLQQPWGGMNPMQVVGAVGFQHRRLDIPDDIDPAVGDIINRCWQTDPKMRPSFSEIMSALKPLQKPVSITQLQKRRAAVAVNT